MNVQSAALKVAAVAALLVGPAAQAVSIGTPYSTVVIESLDGNLNPTAPGVFANSVDDAPLGVTFGTVFWDHSNNDSYNGLMTGWVFPGASPYFLSGDTPTYTTLPRPPNDVVGGSGTIDIYQSYRRTAPDSGLHFTYTQASLELYRDVEVGRTCDNCILAEVGWRAEVYGNVSPYTVLWTQNQSAQLVDDNGVLRFLDSNGHSGTDLLNPLWQWDCPRCGGTSLNRGVATLQAPYRGSIDVSGIPFDPNLPPELQPEYTVHYQMTMRIFDKGLWGEARAFTQDPLGGGGVSFDFEGMVPTDNPVVVVPAPGTWALMLAGLAGLAWRGRRRWNPKLRLQAAAVLLPLALAAPAAQAQAVLTERYATAWGYFIIGYRLLSDSGDEEITRNDLQPTDAFEVFDSGEVSGSQLGNPVYGIASFRSGLSHDFQPDRIQASGSTQLYAAGAQDYVLAGGRAGSNTRFVFTLDQPTAYTLTFDLHGTTIEPRDLLLAGSFGHEGGSSLHSFSGIGRWEVSGMLFPGEYGISGRATAYDNHSGDYSYTLMLGAVPEPAGWAMALAGLALIGGLMHRRQRR